MTFLELDLEAVCLQITISKTAHLFHIVDQISEWDIYCHKQYLRYFESIGGFSETDNELLDKHREIRNRHGWGGGLEQTFYTRLNLKSALEEGVRLGYINQHEAKIEKEILINFESRITDILKNEKKHLLDFQNQLINNKDNLILISNIISRFCLNVSVSIPVFLIANPDDMNYGGGYNGDRLTIEIPRKKDPYPLFLHEILHAFIKPHSVMLSKFIENEPSLNYQTLNEGIAHAFSPGIYHSVGPEADPLYNAVQADIANERSISNPFVRYRRFGLELRSIIRKALSDDEMTINTILPKAVDIWRTIYY